MKKLMMMMLKAMMKISSKDDYNHEYVSGGEEAVFIFKKILVFYG